MNRQPCSGQSWRRRGLGLLVCSIRAEHAGSRSHAHAPRRSLSKMLWSPGESRARRKRMSAQVQQHGQCYAEPGTWRLVNDAARKEAGINRTCQGRVLL